MKVLKFPLGHIALNFHNMGRLMSFFKSHKGQCFSWLLRLFFVKVKNVILGTKSVQFEFAKKL